MAITSHGPLSATAEKVVKVIPKENSLGFHGQIGIRLQTLCTGCSRAGEGSALGTAKEQECSAPKRVEDGGQPQALAPTESRASAFGQRHNPARGDISLSPCGLCLCCNTPCSVGEDLFPEKCLNNLKPQLMKDCCNLLANRKRGREKDTISRKPTCCELAFIRLTVMDALPQWLSSESFLRWSLRRSCTSLR